MHARAVGARCHRLVAKVTGHDLLGKLRPPGAPETHQVFGAHRDDARVPPAARRARQTIQLLCRGFGQAHVL
jgi:hypothetical protein